MTPSQIIDAYVGDVARNLPGKLRADVASELRELLTESLHERTGGQPEAKQALEMVREFGRPAEVAARYHTPIALIDPADTRAYIFVAIVGGALLGFVYRFGAALGNHELDPIDGLEWIGLLTIAMALKGFIQRRNPDSIRPWKPMREPVRSESWVSVSFYLASLAIFLAAYLAPGPLAEGISQGRVDAERLAYTDSFSHWTRFAWLPAILVVMAAARLTAAVRRGWSARLRWLAILVQILGILQVNWHLSYGDIFNDPAMEAYGAPIAALFVLIWAIEVAVLIYQEMGRIDDPSRSPDSAGRIARKAKAASEKVRRVTDRISGVI